LLGILINFIYFILQAVVFYFFILQFMDLILIFNKEFLSQPYFQSLLFQKMDELLEFDNLFLLILISYIFSFFIMDLL